MKKMLRVIKDIDTSTGEVCKQREQRYEPTLTEEGYKVPGHKAGAKIFEGVAFPESMTHAEIGKMTILAKNMIPISNMLGYRSKGCILSYTEAHITAMVGLSPKRGRQFIQKMIDLGVMQRVIRQYDDQEYIEFYINPAYFFAGKRISLNLYLLFREHLDPLLPSWVKQEFVKLAKGFSEKAGDRS